MDRQSQVQTTLQELDSDEFESLVATIWSAMGWATSVTQSSRDQGVDVIATKSGVVEQKLAIQAKCYASENKVGRPSIQQYSSIQEQFPDVDSVAVVTSSGFTSEAISLAKQLNVKTVAGEELARTSIKHLTENQIGDIAKTSTTGSDSSPEQITQDGEKNVSFADLGPSEKDLSSIYKGYFSRYIKEKKNLGGSYRTLTFDVDTEEESEWRGYVLFGQFHLIDLQPENNSLLSRLAKTAEEYGWEIKPPEFITASEAGYNVEQMAKTGVDFSMIIDTSTSSQTPNPRRQAKITSLIFEYLFQIDLSGTKIEESSGRYDSQSTTIE